MQVEANHFRKEYQHKDIFHLAKYVIKKRCWLQHLETLRK
jgi:hypothetical protein